MYASDKIWEKYWNKTASKSLHKQDTGQTSALSKRQLLEAKYHEALLSLTA